MRSIVPFKVLGVVRIVGVDHCREADVTTTEKRDVVGVARQRRLGRQRIPVLSRGFP